jgi:tripartite-type tricarboxylate transporter receptor subunit TctC
MQRRILIGSMVALAAGVSAPSHAQSEGAFPQRPIRMVVPYPAGGPVDVAARTVAKGMSEHLGQPVVVDNKAGAGGTLGTGEVAKAKADGYTILFTLPDPLTYAANLFKHVPYDTLKDLAPITQSATTPPSLVLRNDAPIKDLKELGPKSQGVSFGTWGTGSFPHLIASALARSTGANLTIASYRGGAPAVQDFMGGHIHMTIAGLPAAKDIEAKGLGKIVAVASTQRSKVVPNVPTFLELGLTDPAFTVPSWVGVAAPIATPQPVLQRLNAAAVASLKTPDMERFLNTFGWNAVGGTPAEFRAAWEREMPLVADALRKAGVQPE